MNLHVLGSQVRGLLRTADDLLTEFDRAIGAERAPLVVEILMAVYEETETVATPGN